MENPKIVAARKYCREHNLRYMIKGEALYVYIPTYKKYVQTCFSILNFADEASVEIHIARQMFIYDIW